MIRAPTLPAARPKASETPQAPAGQDARPAAPRLPDLRLPLAASGSPPGAPVAPHVWADGGLIGLERLDLLQASMQAAYATGEVVATPPGTSVMRLALAVPQAADRARLATLLETAAALLRQ